MTFYPQFRSLGVLSYIVSLEKCFLSFLFVPLLRDCRPPDQHVCVAAHTAPSAQFRRLLHWLCLLLIMARPLNLTASLGLQVFMSGIYLPLFWVILLHSAFCTVHSAALRNCQACVAGSSQLLVSLRGIQPSVRLMCLCLNLLTTLF